MHFCIQIDLSAGNPYYNNDSCNPVWRYSSFAWGFLVDSRLKQCFLKRTIHIFSPITIPATQYKLSIVIHFMYSMCVAIWAWRKRILLDQSKGLSHHYLCTMATRCPWKVEKQDVTLLRFHNHCSPEAHCSRYWRQYLKTILTINHWQHYAAYFYLIPLQSHPRPPLPLVVVRSVFWMYVRRYYPKSPPCCFVGCPRVLVLWAVEWKLSLCTYHIFPV